MYILGKLFYKYKRKVIPLICKNYYCNNNESKIKLLFFGTDNFSLQSLIKLQNARKNSSIFSHIDTVTSYKSRVNPVKKFAEENGMICYKWPITEDVIKKKYDLGVVVSFGHLIPEEIIKAFPLGMINVHASLLPQWRGASPIIHSILNEDTFTGVSIMKIRPKYFDIGEILEQKVVKIQPNIFMPELHDTLAKVGADLLVDCIERMPNSLMNAKPQCDQNVSFAPKITDSMIEINWNEMSARKIFNLYRALYSFKYLKTKWHGLRVKFIEIEESSDNTNLSSPSIEPGTVEYQKDQKCLRILCADQNYLLIRKIQIEGKKILTATDFNNGFLKKIPFVDRKFTSS